MIRDTDQGLRYLIPDPDKPGSALVEEHVSRKSLVRPPRRLLRHVARLPDSARSASSTSTSTSGARASSSRVFFGGVLLTANYTDPALGGSRFDLGADLFARAIPFGDVSYRNGAGDQGREGQAPARRSSRSTSASPLGPYLKASLGLFSKWDNYQRDSDTAPDFVRPGRHVHQRRRAAPRRELLGLQRAPSTGDYASRANWEPWGFPGNPDYSPDRKGLLEVGRRASSKDQYFSGFRKLHVSASYLGGTDLDRFSKYEFGTFSGHPMHGYKSGSLRTEEALPSINLSYGLNIEDIIRFEGFYDQAILNDQLSGFNNTYFSGAGLLASLNGPWQNSLLRGEIGVPVVSHGIHGVVVYVHAAQALLTQRSPPPHAGLRYIRRDAASPIPFPDDRHADPARADLRPRQDGRRGARPGARVPRRDARLDGRHRGAPEGGRARGRARRGDDRIPRDPGRPRQDASPEDLRRRARRRFPRGSRADLADAEIAPFDLVVVNLYPFEKTVAGGATARQGHRDDRRRRARRSSAPPRRTTRAWRSSSSRRTTSRSSRRSASRAARRLATRERLAARAFARTAAYDAAIARYLAGRDASGRVFPESLVLAFERVGALRYGENPHQRAALYREPEAPPDAIVRFEMLQGKELSFNNLLDLDSAVTLARDFDGPAAVIVKHNNPCGAGVGDTITRGLRPRLRLRPARGVRRHHRDPGPRGRRARLARSPAFRRSRGGRRLHRGGDRVLLEEAEHPAAARSRLARPARRPRLEADRRRPPRPGRGLRAGPVVGLAGPLAAQADGRRAGRVRARVEGRAARQVERDRPRQRAADDRHRRRPDEPRGRLPPGGHQARPPDRQLRRRLRRVLPVPRRPRHPVARPA